ncbi:MAG: polyprenyl synthetase family protein [Defluviitaleaceae bacterium]|nr:polyprenyl synthetase family protein [Defluviitaleaceae bacterium]
MFTQIINEHLEKNIENIKPYELKEAMHYALMSGGKRLRPNILLLSCSAFSSDYKRAINHAIALEMIHAYSLIHDDLPALDNDDFRRGKPTTHKKFGEAIAILAGDALLNRAFETMLKSRNLYATKIITKAAGTSGMIAGQTADILGKENTFYIHSKKTAALFYAAFYAGATLGHATKQNSRKLAHAGFLFGLYYQLKDDIEDGEISVKANPELILGSCLHIIKNLNLRNDELYEYIKEITKH